MRMMQIGLTSVIDVRSAKPPEKRVDPFYQSAEWIRVRDFVIDRDKGVCYVRGCGEIEGRIFVDHIVEIKDGGDRLNPKNLGCMCAKHHVKKTHEKKRERQARERR